MTVNLTPIPKSPKGNARGSGYGRNADDWYQETPEAVRALLRAERFYGVTLDPACGAGTIPKTFQEFGLDCLGSDLVDRGYGLTGVDYLTQPDQGVDNLAANPPYNLLEPFVLKMIAEAKHKVAVLTRLAWLEGDGRYRRIFEPHPPSRVLVFRNRISVPPGGADIKPTGGSVAYCWVIYNRDHRGPTELDWIRAE